jgi:hypothetical protein
MVDKLRVRAVPSGDSDCLMDARRAVDRALKAGAPPRARHSRPTVNEINVAHGKRAPV